MTDTDTQSETESLPEQVPWRRIANVAGLVLLIAIVLPFVIYAVPQVVGADQSFVVLSGSMEPTISAGDVIIVNSVAASQIDEGDIITYGGERPTTHRVIEVTEQDGDPAFRTKGDANEEADQSLVTPAEVDGKLLSIGGFLFIFPYLGHVVQFVNTTAGFTLLFVVPFVLLVALELRDIVLTSGDGTAASSGDTDPVGDESDGSEATGGETGAEGTDAAKENQETSEEGLTFGAHELQLGIGILVAFVAYSAWVSYVTTEIWAFAATGSVLTAFVLFTGLYLFGGSEPDDPSPSPSDGDGGEGEPEAPGEGTSPPQPPGSVSFDPDRSGVDSGPVEFERGLGEGVSADGPVASGDVERGESDD